MRRHIVVTGLGAITPLANDVPGTWQALIEGRSGIDWITRFDASELDTRIAGEVKGFDPRDHMDRKEARRLDRFTQFAVAATREALTDAGLAIGRDLADRVAVVIGSGAGGLATFLAQIDVAERRGIRRVSPFFIPMMLTDTAAGQVAITFGARGPNMAVVAACATGTAAIGEAAALIARGDADVAIAGAADAIITPIVIAGFNNMKVLSTRNGDPARACRPFDATRDGFVLGEGAGIVILETLDHARRRGAHIYGEVVGYGATADATHMAAPPEDGNGIARAMEMALRRAEILPEEVEYVNAHGTGTFLNDTIETTAMKRVFNEHAHRVAISSTKSMMGHLMGAAGAVEAIVCLKAMETGQIPPTINYEHPDPACDLDYVPNQVREARVEIAMSNSLGLGGHNASLLLRAVNGEEV